MSTQDVIEKRRALLDAIYAIHTGDGMIRVDEALAQRLDQAWSAYDAALSDTLRNNVERAVAILTPLFVKAQESDSPDEEALGGALDVLTGWFGQNGQPLRKLDELEYEIDRLRIELHRVAEGRRGQRERADQFKGDLDRLSEHYQKLMLECDAERWAKQTIASEYERLLPLHDATYRALRDERTESERLRRELERIRDGRLSASAASTVALEALLPSEERGASNP